MKVQCYDLARQVDQVQDRLPQALRRLCHDGRFTAGPEVEAFEREFAQFIGTGHAVAVASGTVALYAGLLALRVGPGHEVILPALAPASIAEAVIALGARPVFADVEPATGTLDPQRLDQALSANTRAVVVVHLHGQPADMDRLGAWAGDHQVLLVEDASQATGACFHGRRVGRFGRIGCFSFHARLPLGAWGDAGAIVTADGELADRLRRHRDQTPPRTHLLDRPGLDYRLDSLQAAVLRLKLTELDRWNQQRRAIARAYTRALAGTDLVLPAERPGVEAVFCRYPVQGPDREGLAKRLAAAGIGTERACAAPLPLDPDLRLLGYQEGDFPVAEGIARRSLCLPMFPELTETEVQAVIRAIVGPGPEADQPNPEQAPPRLVGNVRYQRLGDVIRAFWRPRERLT